MTDIPVVVWPAGTFYLDCSYIGNYYDCTYNFPEYAGMGALVCCPAW